MSQKLVSLLNHFKTLSPKSIDLTLHRMEKILEKLGNPHTHLPPTIHVAGTNGKGSTISYLRHIYQAAGYKVHTYTSPHLTQYEERICLANHKITPDALAFSLDQVRQANWDESALTFFEAKTAAAFLAFCTYKADILLLETGMGGRLDATNVIPPPLACVFTPISLDHQEFLGESIEKIAYEKAGIIKSGSRLFISEQSPNVQTILHERSVKLKTPYYAKNQEWILKNSPSSSEWQLDFLGNSYVFPPPSLKGKHQIENAALAAVTVLGLKDQFPLSIDTIKTGIQTAVWSGRLQRLHLKGLPELWIDGAHNISGFYALKGFVEDLEKKQKKKNIFCLNMLKNRDPSVFFHVFSNLLGDVFIINMPEEDGFHQAHDFNLYSPLPLKALSLEKIFQNQYDENSRIFITGSLYLIGKVLELYKNHPNRQGIT